jgi:beta-glucosidase
VGEAIYDRRRVLTAAALLGLTAYVPGAVAMRALGADDATRIAGLIAQMTLAEKLGQMTQIAGGRQKALNSKLDAAMLDRVRRGEVGSFLHVAGAKELRKLQRVAVRESRLKIPLLFAMDVIHGYTTTFPVPLALASSWDPATMEAAARAAAEEAWAAGLHWTFSPMVDVARDPRWGRVVEGAGEDPYLGSRMAEAQVRGYQGGDLASGKRVMACVKHFAGYGAAIGGRDYDSADLSDRALNEIYLPPFWAAAKAGAGSFMTAFNDIAGVPATANAELVRGTLRGAWGYQGLIVSDWNAIKELINHGVAETPADAAALALRAGVDMDMMSNTYAEQLTAAVAADPSLLPLVDEAVGRILSAKARLGLFDKPYGFGDAKAEKAPDPMVTARAHIAARMAAWSAMVLVRNDGDLLPLKPGSRVALIGALADDASSALGSWRARGQTDDVTTLRGALVRSGMSGFLISVSDDPAAPPVNLPRDGPPITVEYAPGVDTRSDDVSGISAAVEAAKRADVVLLVLGEDYDYTGEARSRASLELPGRQQELIDAVKATGKPIVAIVMSGRPLALEAALAGIPAVLITWFLGVESGPAIADVLTGLVSPSGKLPIGFPRTTGQVPIPYAHLPTGRPANTDLAADSARYHDVAIGPLWPFGHGLSYTEFDYGLIEVTPVGGGARVGVKVTNRGEMTGTETVQLYVSDPVASIERPVRELRGFARVTLKPGQSKQVRFTLAPDQLAIWKAGKWVIEPGEIFVMVASSSDDIRGLSHFRIPVGGEGSAPAAAIETRVEIA